MDTGPETVLDFLAVFQNPVDIVQRGLGSARSLDFTGAGVVQGKGGYFRAPGILTVPQMILTVPGVNLWIKKGIGFQFGK